jgi:hypothetical protein
MAVKPKLALIPSGVKASKVYSVLPSDGVGDFDFSRSGNATRVNKQGLIETVSSNVPRLNYPLIDGVVSGCPSLLLEPARTNFITYSNDFTQGVWSDLRVSLTSNNAISPDGTLNASELTLDATNDSHTLIHSTMTGLSANANHTISVFVKSNGNDKVALRDASVGNYISVDLSNGSILDENNINSSIEKFGNDWYRISLTFLSSSSGQIRPSLYLLEDSYSSGSPSSAYLGDGVSSVYVWGFQAEEQYFPTSYIPSLTGSATTRSAETCNNAGDASTFNDSEGVLMAEINFENQFGVSRYLGLHGSNASNRVIIGNSANTSDLTCFVISNGSNLFQKTISLSDISTSHKIILKYKTNDFSLWVNGFELEVGSVGDTSNGSLNTLSFVGVVPSTQPFYGNTKQLQYFDTALTDTELETLTSWTSFNEMAEGQLYSIQ